MKKFSKLLLGLAVAGTMIFSSCTDDDADPIGPSITSEMTDSTVTPGSTITFSVDIRQGDKNLSHVTFREDGDIIGSRTLTMDGNDVTSLSQYDISSNDIIEIVYEAPSTAGSYIITIGAFDKDELSASVSYTITVAEATTPLTVQTGDYKLFNNDGPAGTGGMSLSDGSSTGSSEGDLMDKQTGAWDGSFEAGTGVTIKSVSSDYYDAAVAEDVEATYTAGSTYANTAPAINDVFIVYDGTDYYVLKVIENNGFDATVSALNGNFIQFEVKK